MGIIAAPAIVRVSAIMPISSRAEWIAPYHVKAIGSDWTTSVYGHFRNHDEAVDRAVRWARDAGYTFDVAWMRRGPFSPRGEANPNSAQSEGTSHE